MESVQGTRPTPGRRTATMDQNMISHLARKFETIRTQWEESTDQAARISMRSRMQGIMANITERGSYAEFSAELETIRKAVAR